MRVPAKTLLVAAALALGPAAGCLSTPPSGEDAASQVVLPDGISPELVAAAKARVKLVAREIDRGHVSNYDLPGDSHDDAVISSQLVDAVIIEFGSEPELLRRRLQSLASMVLFSAPQVTTDGSVGHVTPFHGMDEQAFEALMTSEDFVFGSHMQANGGSPNGVRPFSVCETKYLIEIAKGQIEDPAFITNRAVSNFEQYAPKYQGYAQGTDAEGQPNCSAADLGEWYNFRGLGHLRPTWLESNISDRFLGKMLGECDDEPSPEMAADCERWNASRRGYRDSKNTELTLREMFYDPREETRIGDLTMEDYLANPGNPGALLEDRNGDGVGEWIATGPAKVTASARMRLAKGTTLSLPAALAVTAQAATTVLAGDERRELPAGTAMTVQAGSSIKLTATTYRAVASSDPFGLNAGTKVELPEYTNVTLEDGTSARIPAGYEIQAAAGYKVEARLAAAASFPVDATTPAQLTIEKITTGLLASNNFAYELRVQVALAGGGSLTGTINAQDVEPYTDVDPRWNRDYLPLSDFGLQQVFADGTGCTADRPSPEECPLLKRFYITIDRHENFYQTYSSVRRNASNVSQQPSPLVACSITLRASHHWDTAGIPPGGTAGFIYLMRVPFAQIFAGDVRSIDTLSRHTGQPGPQVLTVQQLYQHGARLDMSRVWLDIATLSNNLYSSEHEVSKFGSVPPEQIEGILVVRLPAAMSGTPEVEGDGEAGEPQG
jgi:hypothetical protein